MFRLEMWTFWLIRRCLFRGARGRVFGVTDPIADPIDCCEGIFGRLVSCLRACRVGGRRPAPCGIADWRLVSSRPPENRA
jgi:hypothetical protein